MKNSDLISQTAEFVKNTLKSAEGGHDWWHTYRVWKTAVRIAEQEKVNMLIVELGSLLHDIADSKFNGGDETIGPRIASEFLNSAGADRKITGHVVKIIKNISFRETKDRQKFRSPELDVVQDADRLDAIGAIGIARAFSYAGFMNTEIYNPGIKPKPDMTKDEYKKRKSPAINHFYEKLFLLKDMMNTETGRAMAEKRHLFMEQYLNEFYREWEGLL